MSIESELLALHWQAKKAGHLLQVEPAVQWAKQHPKSDLHKALPWDDAVAGHEWRCHVMRRLIAIHIVSPQGVRKMLSLSIDRIKPGGGYRDLDDVIAAPDLSRILLADALAELERVRAKYERVAELTSVWTEIDKVKRRHESRKEGKGRRPAA